MRSLVDPTLAVFIISDPLQFLVSHLCFFRQVIFSDPIPAFLKHGAGHAFNV